MSTNEQQRVTREIMATIERGILSKRWLYWPPGPMMGQVFDRALCEKDVQAAIAKAEGGDGGRQP